MSMPTTKLMEEHAYGNGTSHKTYWYIKGYGCVSGIAAFVAVVNMIDGELFDWSCYAGGVEAGIWRDVENVRDVAETGDKIESKVAMALFGHLLPDNAEKLYRG